MELKKYLQQRYLKIEKELDDTNHRIRKIKLSKKFFMLEVSS